MVHCNKRRIVKYNIANSSDLIVVVAVPLRQGAGVGGVAGEDVQGAHGPVAAVLVILVTRECFLAQGSANSNQCCSANQC